MSEASHADESPEQRVARWVEEHAPAVRGFLLGLVRRRDVADDLLQETFRRVWEARGEYSDAGRERSYLLRIADRLAIDHCRRRREQEHSPEQAEQNAVYLCPAEAMVAAENRQQLAAALEQLNESQRRVLLLRYYGDLEFADIAAQLNCPLGTVLSHCHRGLANLRKVFQDRQS